VHLPWWGAWALGYAGILVFALARAVMGSAPTRIGGRFLCGFTVVYAAIALAGGLLARRSISVSALACIVALAGITWLSRPYMLVFGERGDAMAVAMAECGRRLCLTGESTDGGYRFPLPGGYLDVRLREVGHMATLVTLRASPAHRKADLFRRLLVKRYRGALPVIRVRLR